MVAITTKSELSLPTPTSATSAPASMVTIKRESQSPPLPLRNGSTPRKLLPSPAKSDAATPISQSPIEGIKTEVRANNFLVPPQLKFIDIDRNQRLPLPSPPSDPELMKRAGEMVHWAISSKHENSPANILAATNNNNNGPPLSMNVNPASVAAQNYHQLTGLLNRKSSTPLLHATLHAIISSNSGRELDRLVTHSKLHAQLIHLIMKLDPFVPAAGGGGGSENNVGIDKLRELDRVRLERKKKKKNAALALATLTQPASSASPDLPTPPRSNTKASSLKRRPSVQISEASIRHKENAKYITPTSPYFSYEIADVYLHLLITLISNNSILSMSAIRSLWGLLTEFGGRWIDWSNQKVEEERKRRKKRRMLAVAADKRRAEELAAVARAKEEEDRNRDYCEQPSRKRRKLGSPAQQSEQSVTAMTPPPKKSKLDPEEIMKSSQLTTATTPTATTPADNKMSIEETEDEPENERPVPCMSGLSVEFVRDAFCNAENDIDDTASLSAGNGEQKNGDYSGCLMGEIYSDRLASGRVQRLLLALLNIFRLAPRSKSDLLHQMTINFPHHKTSPLALYTWYTHTCLQMVHLVPTFEGPILSLFVDKALDMDVEIKINDKGLVSLDETSREEDGDDGGQDFGDGVTSASPMQSMSKKRSINQISNDSLAAATTSNQSNNNKESIIDLMDDRESDHVLEISSRLDTLMTTLNAHIIRVTSFEPDSLSSAMGAVINARRLYQHLDEVFDKKVRTTDRSKFVQFVFFVLFGRENDALEAVGKLVAKREAEQQLQQSDTKIMEMLNEKIDVTDPLYRGFSAKLIDFFYNPSHASDNVPRQTVVCYLASFVSRATYVCPETVCECVAALLRWAEVYISAQSGTATPASRGNGVRRLASTVSRGNTQHPCEIHALFYTACQAAFYIMCFRGVEAIQYYRKACEHKDDPNSQYANPESVDIGPARWKFLCGHSLQPLKYCLESVRMEFLYLAEDFDLFLVPSDVSSEITTKREEASKLLEQLRQRAGGMSSTPVKTKSKSKAAKIKKRRRSSIISTAATQEKKRLDGGVGGLGRGSNPLDSFFPFDPYLLQKSYGSVHPYYRNWEDCIVTLEEDAMGILQEEEEGSTVCDEDVSDLEDDDEHDHDDSDDDDEEEEGDEEHDQCSNGKAPGKKSPAAAATGLHDENNFEMEIRRSRAMSTGSQCSW